jgi:glycosyltransferase involved in cell wall biosynthesis
MRIVIVSDYGDVNGGAAKVAATSARGLAEAGLSVTFVCAIPPISPLLTHPRIAVHCLGGDSVWDRANLAGAAVRAIWNGGARRALEDILVSLPLDETVVHFHQWTKAFSPSVLVAPSGHGLPSIASLHDYFIACPNGAYYRFPKASPCNLRPMSASCVTARCDRKSHLHKAVRVLRQLATQRAMAEAGASLSLISVSDFADRLLDPLIAKRHSRFVVRSPIEAAKAEPVRVARNKTFLFAGRLTEEKGVKSLAELAREAQLPLTIVGDGPLLGELRAMGGTVRCTGWLTGASLAETMGKARALVFPSTWYETGGLVVLEALARGIPAIVARATAAAEFIVDGENGYLVDAGDWAMFGARMRSLAADSTAARMGEEAYRRYWSDPQTVDVHTANLLSVYRAVLSVHSTRSPAASLAGFDRVSGGEP